MSRLRACRSTLPQTEGVCEVDERADCCARCEQEGLERHLLEL